MLFGSRRGRRSLARWEQVEELLRLLDRADELLRPVVGAAMGLLASSSADAHLGGDLLGCMVDLDRRVPVEL